MALLKKGSKGGDVEKLQEMLNKAGAQLKVDGIFGPLTDKALRKAQTKLKLDKVDGKAGEFTLAALKYGKPLPKMTARDLSKSSAQHDMIRTHNEKMVAIYGSIQKDADELDKLLTQKFKNLSDILAMTKGPRETAARAAADIASVQKDYEKYMPNNPEAAAKCVAAVDRAMPKYDKIWHALDEAVKRMKDETKAIKTASRSAIQNFETGLADLEKQTDATRKLLQKLFDG